MLRLISSRKVPAVGDATAEPPFGELKLDAQGFVDATELRAMIARAVNDARELLVIESGSETHIGALVADLIRQSEPAPSIDGVDLKALVACMDVQVVLDSFARHRPGPENRAPAAIAEQVESATVVALSNPTGAPDDAALADAIVRGLNPAADVILVHGGDRSLDVSPSVPTRAAPNKVPPCGGASPSLVTAVPFHARRPFHPRRFWVFLKTGLDGVFRGKGFFWLASQMNLVGGLNVAGGERQAAPVGTWWAAMPESQMDRAEWPDAINNEWVEPYGDRRQALIFLGLKLDDETLRVALESCLLTHAEMAAGEQSWREFADPFAAWGGAGHMHEHHDCACGHDDQHGGDEGGHGSCCDRHHHEH
ncbi:MAG TPA: GTP-binding protein [Chthoniobacterales bacterium]|nr:GTP-binding protein [Chthoniobacterales bacterium]